MSRRPNLLVAAVALFGLAAGCVLDGRPSPAHIDVILNYQWDEQPGLKDRVGSLVVICDNYPPEYSDFTNRKEYVLEPGGAPKNLSIVSFCLRGGNEGFRARGFYLKSHLGREFNDANEIADMVVGTGMSQVDVSHVATYLDHDPTPFSLLMVPYPPPAPQP